MKWTVLSDNRSCDSQLQTEHGLSILLETDRHRILLDTGASDVFIRNAEKLGINLRSVDYVFISHGHSDHAGGLQYFLGHNRQAQVIVSPDAMSGKFYSKRGNLHSITTEWPEIDDDRLIMVSQTCEIDDGIHVIFRAGDLNNWYAKFLHDAVPGKTNYSEELEEIDPIAHEKQYLGELKDIRKVTDSFDLVMFPIDGRIGNGYTLGGRQFIERFKVGLFVPMHFVASGFDSSWRMKEFTDEKNIPFWEINKEGETIEI